MGKRIDPSWVVFASVENSAHDRCVDLFTRPDGTSGFEEFRRDVEDGGAWTPVTYFSGSAHPSRERMLEAALRSVPWLGDAIAQAPSARHLLPDDPDQGML
ncbi:MAG: hypothetical protein JSR21_08380 [Proteobacteria bacterium]|nr:hypothetical protein [Pseudomonadota bacterium]